MQNTEQDTESARTAEIERVDVLDKVDHTWELVSTTPATCTIGEIQHYKCSVCGETKDVTLSNPLGEHSWDNGKVTKEATCSGNRS